MAALIPTANTVSDPPVDMSVDLSVHAANHPNAIRWLEQIFSERYGVAINISIGPKRLIITLPGSTGSIAINSLAWPATAYGVDSFPCAYWDVEGEGLRSPLGLPLPAPGVRERDVPLMISAEDSLVLSYDIPGLVLWALCRLEERQSTDLDEHGRFRFLSSHGYRHGYHWRPVVDEWLNVLGQVLTRQWPGLRLHRHRFSLELSHDVDRPFMYRHKAASEMARFLAGDVAKRKDFRLAFDRLKKWHLVRKGNFEADPFYTFAWIMELSEEFGYQSEFYFICGHSSQLYDGDYRVTDPEIRRLLRLIYDRGHTIGLHPSYNSMTETWRIDEEATTLRITCGEEGLSQGFFGARMHYLRWKAGDTTVKLSQAGLMHDASLGYSESAAFRCGSCHAFPYYDFHTDSLYPIKVRPLISMDSNIMSASGSLDSVADPDMSYINRIIASCRAVEGKFSMLWHNSSLSSKREKDVYTSIITSTS